MSTTTQSPQNMGYSKPFKCSKQQFLWVSVIMGIYLGVSTFLTYGLIMYLSLDDLSVFTLKNVLWAGFGIVLYSFISYRQMLKLDGQLMKSNPWTSNSEQVTLIELKEHHPFG